MIWMYKHPIVLSYRSWFMLIKCILIQFYCAPTSTNRGLSTRREICLNCAIFLFSSDSACRFFFSLLLKQYACCDVIGLVHN